MYAHIYIYIWMQVCAIEGLSRSNCIQVLILYLENELILIKPWPSPRADTRYNSIYLYKLVKIKEKKSNMNSSVVNCFSKRLLFLFHIYIH